MVTKTYLGINNKAVLIYEHVISWTDGKDSELLAMINDAYAGKIDLSNYWAVGDERSVQFKALSATGVGESHAAQTIPIVLTQVGGRSLANGTTCKFQWAMKNAMAESGYMNSSVTNTNGWDGSARRTWCNNVFKNSCVSSDMNSVLFKQAQYKAGKGDGKNELVTSTDYCALMSVLELATDLVPSTSGFIQGEGTQLDYYKTKSNIVLEAWTRSPIASSTQAGFGYVTNINNVYQTAFQTANTSHPIVVCGVI